MKRLEIIGGPFCGQFMALQASLLARVLFLEINEEPYVIYNNRIIHHSVARRLIEKS